MPKTVYIPAPNNEKQFIIASQTAGDIMKQLERAEKDSKQASIALSTGFKADNKIQTCKRVFDWLKKNIKYDAEPRIEQTGKTISRFVKDGYGDCKHYATFSVGVLKACGIDAYFKLVGQDKTKKVPNHVYCVADVNGKQIIIDPCRKEFNSECKYYYSWTKK